MRAFMGAVARAPGVFLLQVGCYFKRGDINVRPSVYGCFDVSLQEELVALPEYTASLIMQFFLATLWAKRC